MSSRLLAHALSACVGTAMALQEATLSFATTKPDVITVKAGSSRTIGPDLLRAVAILLVMLVHLPLEATPYGLVTIRNYGWLGVDVFFVLSGYLIGTQLFKEIVETGGVDLKTFYLKRALRIFPAYFVVLALYAFVPLFRDTPNMQPLWRFATFTVNFGLDPRTGNAFTQAWTLSVEEQFYLVLPVLAMVFVGRLSVFASMVTLILLVAAGVVCRSLLWEGQIGVLIDDGRAREAFAVYLKDIYYPTYTRLDGLLFGVFLAAARFFKSDLYKRFLPPLIAIPLGSALIAIAIVLFTIRGPLEGTNLFLVFQAMPGAVAGFPLISAGIALLLGAALDGEQTLRNIPVPGVAAVATLSYSLYLTHKSVFSIDRALIGQENLTGLWGFAVYGVTSFAAAFLLWLVVERSFLLVRDRLLVSGRHRTQSASRG